MKNITRFAAGCGMALLVALAGCGGGGGGDGGNGSAPANPAPAPGTTPPTGSNQDGLSITSDKAELRFITVKGQGFSSDRITFTLAGAQTSANYFAMVESDGKIQVGGHIAESSLTTITVQVLNSTNPANIDGNVTFKLCRDEKCANVAWSRAIPYRMRDYLYDTSTIELAVVQGQSASVTRQIAPVPVAGDLSVETPGPWLNAAIEDGGKLVVRNNPAQPKGSYRGYVFLRPSGPSAQVFGINVDLAVASSAVASVPADGVVTLDPRTAGAGQLVKGSVPLAFVGGPARRWSVSSDQPWLVPSIAGGDADAVVEYTIDPARLVLANFASTAATLTFEVSGQAALRHRVVVNKKFPELRAITPALVAANRPATLRLGGRGFDLLDTAGSFTMDGAQLAAGAGAVVSGSQARIDLAGARAGSHDVGLPASVGVRRLGFQAVAVTPLAAAGIDTPNARGEAIHSATRQALYVIDSSAGHLSRVQLTNGAWTLERSVAIMRDARIGLSPDEQTLYTTAPGMTLEERDPDTLAVRASHVATGVGTLGDGFRSASNARLPVTTDGRIWFEQSGSTGLLAFDSVSHTFFAAASASLSGFMDSTLSISGDGGTMLNIKLGGQMSVQSYDVGSGAFKRVDLPLTTGPAAISRDGNYLVIDEWLYQNRDFGVVGTLPRDGRSTYQALLAADGSRIYQVKLGLVGLRLAPVAVSVIDALSLKFIGDFPLPANANACGLDEADCVSAGRFGLSTFGDAIVWSGNRKTMIVPIPQTLAGVGATRSMMVR